MDSPVEEIPGTTGTLQQRVADVIENEVPSTYTDLAVRRTTEAINSWQEEARGRARKAAQGVLAGLMPGTTGLNVANEVADKVLAVIYATEK